MPALPLQNCCALCISVAAIPLCILVSQAIPFAEEGSVHAASDELLARNAIILQHS